MKAMIFKFNFLKIIVLLVSCFPMYANCQEPEELKSQLSKLKGTEKVDQLLKIGTCYAEKYGYADSLLAYSNLAFELSKKINSRKSICKSTLNRAIAFQQKSDYDTAVVLLKKLLPEVEKLNDVVLTGDVYNQLGFCYYRLSNNELALESLIKAVKLYERVSHFNGLAFSYCKLSALFSNEKQAVEAVFYKNKARGLLTKISDPFTKMTLYNSLAGLYTQIQVVDNKLNYLDSTIYCAKRALSLMNELGYLTRANQICNSISDAYLMKQDYAKALDYCKQSFKYRNYLLPGEIIISYLKYSDCSSLLGNKKDALVYLDSVKIEVQNLKDVYYEMAYFERVFQYNKDAGNYLEAVHGLERFKFLQDSLFNVDKTTAINDLMQKYNKVENEKKIVELNKENELSSLNVKFLIVGILSTILAIVIIVFFYRQSILKNKFKLLETEQRLNRARMNPHFFFNALASIQALSEDETTQKNVPRMISKFSKIMRQSLESTYDELVCIEEEIDFIQNYVELQKTRFPNKFDYSISTVSYTHLTLPTKRIV